MIIPYVPMSKEKRIEVEKSLSDSNKILENYHSLIAKRQGRLGFRTVNNENFTKIDLLSSLIKHNKSSYGEDFLKDGVVIPKQDIQKIIASKNLEEEILSSFSRMFVKISNRWSSICSDACLSKDDLESEIIGLAITAIYTYQAPEALSTYLYTSINNGIRRLRNTISPLSKLGKRAIQIQKSFENSRKILGYGATFDDIVEHSKLKEKDIKILQSMSATVISQSDVLSEDGNSASDYTFLGKKFLGLNGSSSYTCKSNGKSGFTILSETDERIEEENSVDLEADLSELEKIVLKGYLQSNKNLGINSLAKDIINPKTNKPYSRMAITYAWRRVKEKIKYKYKVA